MKRSSLVDELSGVLLVFEIFGLQFFSLKSVFLKKSGRKWLILRMVHISVFCALGFGFAYSVIRGSFDIEKITRKNVLTIFYLHLVNNGYVLAILTSLVQSIYFIKETKEFFKNSQEISEICFRNFNISMDFKQFRSSSFRKIWVTLIFVFLMFVVHIKAMKIPSEEMNSMVIALFLCIFNSMIACKYSFYVSFVNFQLSYLEKLLSVTFESKPWKNIVEISLIEVVKKPVKECLRKLNKIWQVYNKIYENGSIVNKSNGLTMLVALIVYVMIITYEGYEMCVSLMDVTHLQSPLSKQEQFALENRNQFRLFSVYLLEVVMMFYVVGLIFSSCHKTEQLVS